MQRLPLVAAAALAMTVFTTDRARADITPPPADTHRTPEGPVAGVEDGPFAHEKIPTEYEVDETGGWVDAVVEDAELDIPREIAVDVKDDVSDADLRDLELTYGLRPNSSWSRAHDKLETGFVALTDDENTVLETLARDPRVEAAEPMEVMRASFIPNDPLYEKQWHLTRVGAEKAWDYTCGEGATVAVVDTGVACFDKGPFSRGTDLGGTRCGGGYNFVHDAPEAYDDQGHGTHVAGTIAQTTNNGKGVAGLAYCARLMPIKVLNRFGWGTLADVAEGIRYAADNGAQIINLSLGGSGKSRILEQAVDHALSKGVVVVAAAGNSGKAVGYPAGYEGVIAVSATDSNDTIAWFSSRGPQVVIAAPGVGVTQQTICNGGRDKCEIFGTFNGTSMASPHVAGAAAMMVGLGVSGPNAIRDALASTAVAKDNATLYGAGILNAGAAAAHVFWRHLVFRGLALLGIGLLVARRIRRKGGKVARSPATWIGALVGGTGLVPIVPLLGIAPGLGSLRWVAELAMRPFGEWDLVFWGAGVHRWLPFASALPVVALTVLLFGVKRLRSLLGGFALGTAALLTQIAITVDVAAPFGLSALRGWTVLNLLVCMWLARLLLDAKRA
jgi:serine protease